MCLVFPVTAQPAILSELLCILGAEGCAVDVSTSVEFKVPFRIGLLLLLVFPVTAQPAILSELLCILGAEGCAVDIPSELENVLTQVFYGSVSWISLRLFL